MRIGQLGKGWWRPSTIAGQRLLVLSPVLVAGVSLALAFSGTATAVSSVGHSTTAASTHRVTYTVKADIDGHSFLTLSGNKARWYNARFAAPGRHDGQNYPTIINGVKWYPNWPNPGENRDCYCYSSIYTHLTPRVPVNGNGFFFKGVSCRDRCSVTKWSDGVLVINFNDCPSGSDAWYTVKITLTYQA